MQYVVKGIRLQFRLLEKSVYKIVRTETDMARFDWLLFTCIINNGG